MSTTYATLNSSGAVMSYEEVKDFIINNLDAVLDKFQASEKKASDIFVLLKDVVYSIQVVDDQWITLTSDQKKELAVDLIIWLIYDELDIDIPVVPDIVEKAIFKAILNNWIIDFIVDWVKGRIE